MIVIDTNVISAIMRDTPDPAVFTWLNAQPTASIWTTSISVLEICYGIDILPDGKRKRHLMEEFEQVLAQDLAGRVLDFDAAGAAEASRIGAAMRSKGRPPDGDMRDIMIAGIVATRKATLATHNTKHFQGTGVALVDPWAGE